MMSYHLLSDEFEKLFGKNWIEIGSAISLGIDSLGIDRPLPTHGSYRQILVTGGPVSARRLG